MNKSLEITELSDIQLTSIEGGLAPVFGAFAIVVGLMAAAYSYGDNFGRGAGHAVNAYEAGASANEGNWPVDQYNSALSGC